MREYVDIGSGPANESCAQVGQEGYREQARAECNRFIALVRKTLGEEPGAHLAIKSNPHDFGSYLDVVCYFDTNDEEAARYAYRCEDEAPTEWEEGEAESHPAAARVATTICDSCQEAAIEEGAPDDLEGITTIMTEMGADVADHLCDQVESGGDVRCGCACQRR